MTDEHNHPRWELTRRNFLRTSLLGGALAVSGISLWDWLKKPSLHAQTFIGAAPSYSADLGTLMGQGFQALGITASEIQGKRILLKPNLVETLEGAEHINTHPSVIHGAIEAFLRLGAHKVYVGEGPGHRRDTLDILEESGMAKILHENRIQFFDLNNMNGFTKKNVGGHTSLSTLTFPGLFQEVDWIVSMAKLKTHHWAGVTLSMKNLFGVMPGLYYGWPKNVLHHAGINQSIVDISATLRPHFAIIDGIIGMEGDGPIMGDPIHSGVLIMGRNLPAVDATGSRLMGINPHRIGYLEAVSDWLGPIHEAHIQQVGENISSHMNAFSLLDTVPAHHNIRLS